jgi:DNA-binding transcriptional LysR family regulator
MGPNRACAARAHCFVLDGQGVMIETLAVIADDLKSGRLVQVLPELKLRAIEVFAVDPANAPKDGLAHLCIEYLLQQTWIMELGWRRP